MQHTLLRHVLPFEFQCIDAVNRRKFTVTNDKLQMNGMGFAHDFKSFPQKTPQFVFLNYEFRASAGQTSICRSVR